MIGTQWAVARSFADSDGTLDGVLDRIQELAWGQLPKVEGDDVALIQAPEAQGG